MAALSYKFIKKNCVAVQIFIDMAVILAVIILAVIIACEKNLLASTKLKNK